MNLFQKITEYYYLPKLRRLEKDIGCKLVFNHIPERYISAVMSCDMTRTWKRFGLKVEKGLNHFTMGKVENGMSSRFDRNASEYQSWLGGYTVKLADEEVWSFEDHCKLAIADQNSWLRRYGDPNPHTSIEGFERIEISKIQLGKYSGTIYEFGLATHSDVGSNPKTLKLLYGIYGMAALYNLANSKLNLIAEDFMPQRPNKSYETLELKGYIGIFDIKPRVKLVLYGNGTKETFPILKEDLLKAFQSCEIVDLEK